MGKSREERIIAGSVLKGGYRTVVHELVGYVSGNATPTLVSNNDVSSAGEASPFDGSWQGEQSIWAVKSRVEGGNIEGSIRCWRKGSWSPNAPKYRGTVDNHGSVVAITIEDDQGWAPRQIVGKLPSLRVVGFGKLDCPNGEVMMKKDD